MNLYSEIMTSLTVLFEVLMRAKESITLNTKYRENKNANMKPFYNLVFFNILPTLLPSTTARGEAVPGLFCYVA